MGECEAVRMLSTCIQGLQMVKALDYRPRGPRFQPHYSKRDFFTYSVYSALLKKVSRRILKIFSL